MYGKMRKHFLRDAGLFLALLLLAGGALLWQHAARKTGAWAVVTRNGREIARYALSEDREETFTDGEGGFNRIVIRDGAVWVEEANCKNRICVRHAAIRRDGEIIVCRPHRLTVEVTDGEAG